MSANKQLQIWLILGFLAWRLIPGRLLHDLGLISVAAVVVSGVMMLVVLICRRGAGR